MIEPKSSLLISSRRGFLFGLGALVAAPAIVKFENLMPIQVLETWGPNGLLTIQMITREFAKLMALQTVGSPLFAIRGAKQSHVDMNFSTFERTLSLQQFSDRILKPAANSLARYVGNDKISSASLELPQGVSEATNEVLPQAGIAVRGLTDYHIGTNSLLTRFDITHG